MGELIALGSLAVAAISMIVGFVQRNKAAAARDQLVIDKLDGKVWVSDIDNNVWEPGVYGWSDI